MNHQEKEVTDKGHSKQVRTPDGVRPETRAFLDAARASGADHVVDERRKRLINIYFSSRVSTADLVSEAGASSPAAVQRIIRSELETIWEALPSQLQATYPIEQVI